MLVRADPSGAAAGPGSRTTVHVSSLGVYSEKSGECRARHAVRVLPSSRQGGSREEDDPGHRRPGGLTGHRGRRVRLAERAGLDRDRPAGAHLRRSRRHLGGPPGAVGVQTGRPPLSGEPSRSPEHQTAGCCWVMQWMLPSASASSIVGTCTTRRRGKRRATMPRASSSFASPKAGTITPPFAM